MLEIKAYEVAANILLHLKRLPTEANDAERQTMVADIIHQSFHVDPTGIVEGRIVQHEGMPTELVIETRVITGRLSISGGLLSKTISGQRVKVTLTPMES